MADLNRYVEVVSSASMSREVQTYRTQLEVAVTTRKKHSCLDESLDLREQVISGLRNAGIDDDDIEERGGQVTQSSWSSSKSVVHQLQVSSTQMSVLVQAMANVETLFTQLKHSWFSGIKKDFTFSLPTPVFTDDDPTAVENALRSAVANGRRKAGVLAEESGFQLGEMISITEEPQCRGRQENTEAWSESFPPFDEECDFLLGEQSPSGPPRVSYSSVAPRHGAARTYFRIRFGVCDAS